MLLSNEDKVEIVLIVGNKYKTHREAATEFNANHPERENISHVTVGKVMEKFQSCSPNFFKFRPAVAQENNDDIDDDELNVLLHVTEEPKKSLAQRSHELDYSIKFIRTVLEKNKYKPFKPKFIHTLFPGDMDIRFDFCHWIMGYYEDHPNFGSKILFSDEATFTTNGIFSSQNSRYWSTTNPKWVVECRSQVSQKVNVWCGVLGNRILGPIFFDHNINGQIFLNFLQNDFSDIVDELPLNVRQYLIFQLDGAPCHFSAEVRAWLNLNFTGKWIGRASDQDDNFADWPPRSPDLTPLDFFLWGRIKEIVYKDRPKNLIQLKNRIREACEEIPADHVRNAVRRFKKNLIKCIENNGGSAEA